MSAAKTKAWWRPAPEPGTFYLSISTLKSDKTDPASKPWAERSPGERVISLFSRKEREFIAGLLGTARHYGPTIRPNMSARGRDVGLTRRQVERLVQKMVRLGWLIQNGYDARLGRYTYTLPGVGKLWITQAVRREVEAIHRRGGGHATSRQVGRMGGRPRKGIAEMETQRGGVVNENGRVIPTVISREGGARISERSACAYSDVFDSSDVFHSRSESPNQLDSNELNNSEQRNEQRSQVEAEPTAPPDLGEQARFSNFEHSIPSTPTVSNNSRSKNSNHPATSTPTVNKLNTPTVSKDTTPAMTTGQAGRGPDLECEIRALGKRLLPRFPGPDMIRPAVTPPPKVLDPKLSDEAKAQAVYAAFQAAVDLRFPELRRKPPSDPLAPAKAPKRRSVPTTDLDPFWGDLAAKTAAIRATPRPAGPLPRRGDITKSPLYRDLVQAADMLIEREIPLVSWCLFSVDTWISYLGDKTNGPPRLKWVISANRINDRADWYHNEAGRYVGGQTYVADEHKALLHAYRKLWNELFRAAPKSRGEVIAVMDRLLPGDTWERMVEAARAGTRRLQSLLDSAVARGTAW